MLCSNGWVRVRQPDNHNEYDDCGWSNPEVLIERWLLLDEMRAERLRELSAMQAEMDAIEKQSDKKLTGAARQAVSK